MPDAGSLLALVIGAGQVALLAGIFFRLGGHNARLKSVEDQLASIWKKIDGVVS